MSERQQILHLWLHVAALDAAVATWSFYDGTDGAIPAPQGEPPYRNGRAALRDGWMLIQAPGPIEVASTNGELPAEFVFERRTTSAH